MLRKEVATTFNERLTTCAPLLATLGNKVMQGMAGSCSKLAQSHLSNYYQ